MSEYESTCFIRNRIEECRPALNDQSIRLEEAMIREYMVKFDVLRNGRKLGRFIVDYSAKKKKITTRNESLDDECFVLLKEILSNEATQAKKSKPKEKPIIDPLRQLKEYYKVIKNYRLRQFEFSEFAEMIADHFENEKEKEEIKDVSEDFDTLENYYMDLINGRTGVR